MSHPDQSQTPAGFFARGDRATAQSNAELRQQVPVELLQIFDAVSIARNMPRHELVHQVLAKQADQWMHESTLLQRVTRGNPAFSEADGGDRA